MRAGAATGLTAVVLAVSSMASGQTGAEASPATAAESGIARPVVVNRPSPRFTGLLQLDAARYVDAPGDAAPDLRSGINLRRARLGIEGEAGSLRYAFAYDFGGAGGDNKGRITSAWLQYDGLDPLRVRAGAFAHTQGIEGGASQALFAERASPSAIVRAMAGGDGPMAFGVSVGGARWSGSAAITGEAIESTSARRQRALTGRIGVLVIQRAGLLVHVGSTGSAIIRLSAPEGGPGMGRLRLRERPEFRIDDARLIDTGAIAARNAIALGLELAVQARRFSAHGEYFRIGARRRDAELADPFFQGWYIQGAWTIIGKPRSYKVAGSTFDGPTPEHGFNPGNGRWGAFELGARYSRMDLDYRAGRSGEALLPGGVRGGRQRVVSLGVNWYPTGALRFQAAVQDASIDRLSPGGGASNRDVRILSFRTQYAY